MEPDLKVGFFVEIVGIDKEKDHIYEIIAQEGFTYETNDGTTSEFSSVNSGSESGSKTIANMEPDDTPKHLYWAVPSFEDGCEYYFKVPTGTDRFSVDENKSIAHLNNLKSPRFAPDPKYAFWAINDFFPAINAKNNQGFAITPKVYFDGLKYKLEEVKADRKAGIRSQAKLSKINIGGL